MDFLELVTGARTCRRFREAEGMPAGMLDWLIACARVTPCGGNAQALRFAVAESPEACAAVFPALKWAGMLTDWDGPEAGERPTGYVAILGEAGTRAKLNAIDAGIAAQMDMQGRSLKSQFKVAGKTRAAYVLVIGPDELASGTCTARNMNTHEETPVSLDTIAEDMARLL